MDKNLKCIHCVEEYILIPEDQKTPERWDEVQDAVTMAPSWQSNTILPGQLLFACVTLPVCLDHIALKAASPEEIATRSGLVVPNLG